MTQAMKIAGLVLMGGKASRLGGGDKALIEIAGRSVLQRLLNRFAGQVGPLALSANGDPARLGEFGMPILKDLPDAPDGPLGGVLAGLAWASGQPGISHLATLPGDGPSPPLDLVARLRAAAGEGAAVAHGLQGVEPLHALWPVAAEAQLKALVAEGLQSPKRALDALDAAEVIFDGANAFMDLDTPEDVVRAEALFGRD